MKVTVKVKHAPLNQIEEFLNQALAETQADLAASYEQFEKLLQENKDLRVREGHQQDEIKALEHRCEKAEQESYDWYSKYLALQSQASIETHELRNELNAMRHELEEKSCDAYTKLFEDFNSMKHHYAEACADRDNLQAAYKQLEAAFTTYVRQTNEDYKILIDECSELRGDLQDREARIDELEQRNAWLEKEMEFWKKAAGENAEIAKESIEEKAAFEEALRNFEETRQDYEAQIKLLNQQKRDLYQQLAEAQKRADDNYDKLKACRKQLLEANAERKIPDKFNSVWDVLAAAGYIKNQEDENNG